jgi:hypothetical protein
MVYSGLKRQKLPLDSAALSPVYSPKNTFAPGQLNTDQRYVSYLLSSRWVEGTAL